MDIDIDGFLATLDGFRASILHKMNEGDPVMEDDLYAWQPALLAYTAGAIIKGLRAERDHARSQRDGLAESMIDQARDLLRAEAERDEMAATIANERGDGEPPSAGWYWDARCAVWTNRRLGRDIVRRDAGDPSRWSWSVPGLHGQHPFPTARAAMRAVDAAVVMSSGTMSERLVVISTRRDGTMDCDVRALLDRGEVRPAGAAEPVVGSPAYAVEFEQGDAEWGPGGPAPDPSQPWQPTVGPGGPVTASLFAGGVALAATVPAGGPVDAGVFLTYAGDGQFFRHGEPVVTDAQLGAAVREIARLFYEGSQRRW